MEGGSCRDLWISQGVVTGTYFFAIGGSSTHTAANLLGPVCVEVGARADAQVPPSTWQAAIMLRLMCNLCLLLFTTLAHASLVREIAPAVLGAPARPSCACEPPVACEGAAVLSGAVAQRDRRHTIARANRGTAARASGRATAIRAAPPCAPGRRAPRPGRCFRR